MDGKKRLFIGLLVVGLVLVGSGLWLLLNPVPRINIPESTPVIAMDITQTGGGTRNQLLIYEEGTIIYREDTGLRPGQVKTRAWSKGKLHEGELADLLEFINDSGFEALNSDYEFPGIPVPTENFPEARKYGDLYCTISVDNQDLQKAVSAASYMTPDGGMTYPDMPYPLNEIYRRLRTIIEDKTEEVYCESI
ncbi:hypothetical protein ES708_00305 [subsurface metagenome]